MFLPLKTPQSKVMQSGRSVHPEQQEREGDNTLLAPELEKHS